MKILKNIFITAAMLAAATAICFILRPLVPTDTHVPLIYVLAVLCVSRLTEGYFYGVLASMVAVVGVNYIFTYPYFQVDFTVTGYPLTFIVMLTVSISVSALMTQIKMQEHVRLKAEKERMRANLLRAVSHDIRTPLTSIEGAAAGIIDNKDVLTEEQKEEQFEFVVKMAVIIKELMNGCDNLDPKFSEEAIGHNAIAAGFQGQRQWTDFYPNGDFAEAMLNTSFDWDGAREPYILATENDVLNGLGMLFMKLLTGRAQMFADVRTYWSANAVKRVTGYDLEGVAKENDGIIHLINSGACCLDASGVVKDENGEGVMKEWWNVTEEDQKAIMKATTWNAADNGYFRGGGFSSRFETRATMPATMIRLNLVKGLGPVLQIAEGWTVELPEAVSDTLWKRTDYTWPCTWFVPRCDGKDGAFKSAYDVMNNWGANHGAISYGHIGADLITMCSMLRIPVCMHNVPETDIFRPAAWNAFGMDKEGADFRACKNYGPLYK